MHTIKAALRTPGLVLHYPPTHHQHKAEFHSLGHSGFRRMKLPWPERPCLRMRVHVGYYATPSHASLHHNFHQKTQKRSPDSRRFAETLTGSDDQVEQRQRSNENRDGQISVAH